MQIPDPAAVQVELTIELLIVIVNIHWSLLSN